MAKSTKKPDTVSLPDPAEGEFIANRPDTANAFGGYRHICVPDTDEQADTYSARCNRKKAPRNIVGRSLEVVDAYDLMLNKTPVCPTCEKKANLKHHIDWGGLRNLVRQFADEDGTIPRLEDDERIPVRASFNVEIDFPASAKYDLIEAVRDLIEVGTLDTDFLPMDVVDVPSVETNGELEEEEGDA